MGQIETLLKLMCAIFWLMVALAPVYLLFNEGNLLQAVLCMPGCGILSLFGVAQFLIIWEEALK
jgi:hypothetical protein